MRKKWFLRNRNTGKKFKATRYKYPVLYDSGYPVFILDNGWDGLSVEKVFEEEWEIVWKDAKDE